MNHATETEVTVIQPVLAPALFNNFRQYRTTRQKIHGVLRAIKRALMPPREDI